MKARAFFCEACGKPVGLKDDRCPHCGRSFESVKCPRCGFSGRPDLFSKGCPSCGYLKPAPRSGARETSFSDIESGLVTPESDGMPLESDRPRRTISEPRKKRRRQLPQWAYPWLTVALLLLLAAILFMYVRL